MPTIEINSTVSTLFEANAWPVVVMRGRGKRWEGRGNTRNEYSVLNVSTCMYSY